MQKRLKTVPIALTIAGSDSGGGAGIQADLKTFASLRVHGTSVITCLTAQNPVRVMAIEPCSPAMIRAQLQAVFDEVPPHAAKTGMLYSAKFVELVADWFQQRPHVRLVVDPVMIATSGAALFDGSSAKAAFEPLLPLATLVTPNLDEAACLTGMSKLRSVEEMRDAARQLHHQFGCAALIKGGHLRGKEAVDILFDGRDEFLLSAPYVRGVSTHGTGCTYSAAIAAHLAVGSTLTVSVQRAKEYISRAVALSYRVGRHDALNSFRAGG